jgi:RNA polymerase sigma-70 factor (ECF subfamily)
MGSAVTTPSLNTVLLHQQVERIQAGDRDAQEELVRAIARRMERMARSMLRNYPNVHRWADTNDVFQNSVLRLLATLRQLRPASTRDFFNLTAVHVRRELLDLARRFAQHNEKLYLAGGATDSSLDPLAEAAAPESGADRLELWKRLHEAIEELPPEERETISLVFYHGWTHEQIAEVLGVTARSVRRYRRSACEQLCVALGEGVDALLG